MDPLTLKPREIQCWGRGNDIEALLKPIHGKKRSITLVYGDSGIGKTTLLKELRIRLAGEGIFRGFYECQRGAGADPLLRCLNSLLEEHIHTVEAFPELVAKSLPKVKDRLRDPKKLVQLFSGALGAAGEAPAVGGFVKMVSKSLCVLADFAGPGVQIPQEMISRLPPEVFSDLLIILAGCFPNHRFVFVIDNLSADAESQANMPGVTRVTDALLSFIETTFSSTEGVHFVFSWKHFEKTRAAFDELRHTLEQYGGKAYSIGSIGRNETSEWMFHDFPWFRAASQGEKVQVLNIAGGLPQVVAEWKDREIDTLDLGRLTQIAQEDVVKGRYRSLDAELRGPLTVSSCFSLPSCRPFSRWPRLRN